MEQPKIVLKFDDVFLQLKNFDTSTNIHTSHTRYRQFDNGETFDCFQFCYEIFEKQITVQDTRIITSLKIKAHLSQDGSEVQTP